MLNPPIRPIGLRRRLRLQNYKNILKKTNRIQLYTYSFTKNYFSLFEQFNRNSLYAQYNKFNFHI